MMKKDIEALEDVKLLVDTFYGKIRIDSMLGGLFNGVIQDRWPAHLEKMYTFWQTILLKEATYNGHPFRPHAELPVEKSHFDRWISLFHASLDELFSGPTADFAKKQSEIMAEMFMYRISKFRNDPSKFIQ